MSFMQPSEVTRNILISTQHCNASYTSHKEYFHGICTFYNFSFYR